MTKVPPKFGKNEIKCIHKNNKKCMYNHFEKAEKNKGVNTH